MVGKYIVVEGVDGTGKSTVCEDIFAMKRLDKVAVIQEPGGIVKMRGGYVGDYVPDKSLFQHFRTTVRGIDRSTPRSHRLAYSVLRSNREFLYDVIMKLLDDDFVVVSDRNIISSLVYQDEMFKTILHDMGDQAYSDSLVADVVIHCKPIPDTTIENGKLTYRDFGNWLRNRTTPPPDDRELELLERGVSDAVTRYDEAVGIYTNFCSSRTNGAKPHLITAVPRPDLVSTKDDVISTFNEFLKDLELHTEKGEV